MCAVLRALSAYTQACFLFLILRHMRPVRFTDTNLADSSIPSPVLAESNFALGTGAFSTKVLNMITAFLLCIPSSSGNFGAHSMSEFDCEGSQTAQSTIFTAEKGLDLGVAQLLRTISSKRWKSMFEQFLSD
jgi:hypothetical protein